MNLNGIKLIFRSLYRMLKASEIRHAFGFNCEILCFSSVFDDSNQFHLNWKWQNNICNGIWVTHLYVIIHFTILHSSHFSKLCDNQL